MEKYVFSLWGVVIFAVVCSSLATIVTVVAKQWRKARDAEIEATLKADMIKQGRSADEIERILKASGKSGGSAPEDA